MADIDLPVWTIPPNWSTPVTERLEWLTDVLQSRSMAEQRRAIRLTPRRYFEFVINPVDAVRSYVDQWSHRISDERMLLPLWHDKGKLTDDALTAATRLDLDTRWMEFVEGGLALLYYNPFKYETVEIDAIDDDGLDLSVGLADDWPEGTSVYPLRRAYMDPAINLSAITSRVGESTLEFMIDDQNPYDPGAEVLAIHEGYPVVMMEPNRMDALDQQFGRIMEELDLQIGRVRRYDENLRSYKTQFYNWQAKGREQHHKLRQTLYRLKGRQKGVWMPSFNEDIVLAANLTGGQNQMQIQKIGYHQLGGLISGRDRVLIRDNTGTQRLVKLNGSANVSDTVERLNLTANAGFAANAGRPGSFVELVRLDQDAIEITHHTDSEGVCEVSAAFKSFSPARVPPALLIQETVVAEMSSAACGTALEVPCPLFFAEFDGWDYEVTRLACFSQRVALSGWYAHRPVEFGGASGGGNAYGGKKGADWDTTFAPPSALCRWSARRVLIPESQRDMSMVGVWHGTSDMGIVNFFGTKPPLNVATIQFYIRHWSEPFPGNLVFTKTTTGNGTFTVPMPQAVDWRDWR